MIRVIIAEDEAAIRRGLIHCIRWDELGLELAAETENGRQALDFLIASPVDILITMAAVDANTHQEVGIMQIVNLFEDEENFDRLRACRTEQEVLDLIDRTNAAA